jgi:DNA-binding phage protein
MVCLEIQKIANQYICEHCDYKCSKHSDYLKHIGTRKHKIATMEILDMPIVAHHMCSVCDKSFKTYSGLWKHSRKCITIPKQPDQPLGQHHDQPLKVSSEDMQMTLILELVKQNQEFKDMLIQQSSQMMEQNKNMVEVAKNSQINNNTINNTNMSNNNSNNKTFNLNFFLNETCKDAMNMKDFIKSLEMSFSELEKMGEMGFAEGMSRLFVDRLNKLDITKRPIHCSDVKREIIHIKDDNKWERDNANLDRLRKIIKQLTIKNILRVDDWKKANTGCTEYNSRKNGQYLKMHIQALGPVDDDEVKRDFGKIIRRVAETTAIDKKYLCL